MLTSAPHRLAPCKCPDCNKLLDAATPTDPSDTAGPVPGDITICIACGSILQFTKEMQVEPIKSEVLMDLSYDITQQLFLNRNAILRRNSLRQGVA